MVRHTSCRSCVQLWCRSSTFYFAGRCGYESRRPASASHPLERPTNVGRSYLRGNEARKLLVELPHVCHLRFTAISCESCECCVVGLCSSSPREADGGDSQYCPVLKSTPNCFCASPFPWLDAFLNHLTASATSVFVPSPSRCMNPSMSAACACSLTSCLSKWS